MDCLQSRKPFSSLSLLVPKLLGSIVWAAALLAVPTVGQCDSPAASDVAAERTWRRTTYGWEDSRSWKAPPPVQQSLHPAVPAAFCLLASLFALVAWPASSACS